MTREEIAEGSRRQTTSRARSIFCYLKNLTTSPRALDWTPLITLLCPAIQDFYAIRKGTGGVVGYYFLKSTRGQFCKAIRL